MSPPLTLGCLRICQMTSFLAGSLPSQVMSRAGQSCNPAVRGWMSSKGDTMSGSPLGTMGSLGSSCGLEPGKKSRFPCVFRIPQVGVGVPHPGVSLCWFTLEDGWDCMSLGKALSAGRESHPQTLKYSCKNLVSRVVATRAFHTVWPGLDYFPATRDMTTKHIVSSLCWARVATGLSSGNT